MMADLNIIRRGTDLVLDAYDYFVLNKLYVPTNLLSEAKVLLSGSGDRIGLFLEKSTPIGWSSTTSAAGAPDTGLARSKAGTLKVTDGDTGYANLILNDIPEVNKITMNDDAEGIVLPKTSGIGLMVDPTTPTFGWNNLIGDIRPKASGGGAPTLTLFTGTHIYAYSFIASDVCDFAFNIPHDYVPGSNLYFNIHWAHIGTSISGNIVFDVYMTYAKGHNQQNFVSEVSSSVTYNTVNISTTPQYRHRIEELQISASSPSGSQLDSDDIEPDGILLVRLSLNTSPTISGGSSSNPFVLMADLHYQSTSMPTKSKSPNFYS